MKWNVEWNDIHTINSIIKLCKKMQKQQRKNVYNKLYAERELRFGSALGEVFLQEFARIVHGISDYSMEQLESDAQYIERTIQIGMEWEENIWRDLYEMLCSKKNGELYTPLGIKFLEIFKEKLILEENRDYQELQHDFRQIERIYKRVDFEDQEKSKNTIRILSENETGIFRTKIGYFFMNQMKRNMNAETSTDKMQRVGLKVVIYLLLIGCISSGSIGIYVKLHSANKMKNLKQEKELYLDTESGRGSSEEAGGQKEEDASNSITEQGTSAQEGDQELRKDGLFEDGMDDKQDASQEKLAAKKQQKVLPQYKKIKKNYPDFWGWLKIPDTVIDYPIMQSQEADFYLNHDYEGEDSREGAAFVDGESQSNPLDNYIVVYAHNMKNGNMFGDLELYEKEDYLQEHPIIYFDTAYEMGEYEILTVLRTHILNQNEEGFRYYQQFGYRDKATFKQIKHFIKENQLMEPTAELKYGDQLLLLSTCEYTQENGRFVVVARKK